MLLLKLRCGELLSKNAFKFDLRRCDVVLTLAVRTALVAGSPGRAVQVDPMKPKLKPPGTKRSKLKCDMLLSTSAFNFNLHHYSQGRTPDSLRRKSATSWYCPTSFGRSTPGRGYI
jgi:hypothetical protein